MKKILLLIVLVISLSSSACKKGNEYKVIFDNDGQKEVVTYKENEKVVFDVVTKEGYTFNGWTLNGEIVESYKVTSDVTFVASFKKLKYNITFDINGKTETISYEYGDIVTFPDATLEGFEFTGWMLNGEVVDSFVVNADATFVAAYNEINYIQIAKDYLTSIMPTESKENIVLPTEYQNVKITWKTNNENAISKSGIVTQLEYEADVTLTATLKFGNNNGTIKFKVSVPKLEDDVILNSVLDSYSFDDTVEELKLNLKSDFSTKHSIIVATWESLAKEYLSDDGIILVTLDEEKEVQIKLTLTLNESSISKTFTVVIPAVSMDELVNMALENANIETIITSNSVYLPTEFEYDLVGNWTSSDDNIIDNNGNVKVNANTYKEVTMTLTLKDSDGQEVKKMDYTFKVQNKSHLPIVHANAFNINNMDKVELVDGRLVLKTGETYGEYESDVLETISFNNCVPSWAAITSKNATVEFQIKARVNGSWSKYITYCSGGWGLGLQNRASNQSDTLVKLSTDEFIIQNNASSDAIQFKLILRRTAASNESPEVSLCAFALKGTNYSAPSYSLSDLPSNVKHVVPKLYQGAVPSIGNSICSPTSSTMLLKYKGLDFSDKDSQFEHRYIAGLARDYGNAIYGNWVYNTVTMGAFGFNSYVARFYSVAELCHHIATVGPVACSMKGQMTSDKKDYHTNGHLITIIGYEYNNGTLTLISNDPNVPEVECRYSETVFTDTWRNIVYVIE